MKVSFPADGEVMQVSIEAKNPNSAVKIVNAVVNAYMDEVVLNERNERLQRRDNLERVYSEAEGKVRSKRAELKSLASALGTSDSDSLTVAQQNALQQFGLMQEKLSEVQFRLMQAEGEYSVAKDTVSRRQAELANGESNGESSNLEFEKPAEILKLEGEIDALQTRLDVRSQQLGPQHPSVKTLATELRSKQQQVVSRLNSAKKLFAEKVKSLAQAPRPTGKPGERFPEIDLIGMASKVEVYKNQEKILRAQVDKLSEETRQLGRSSIDVELMRSEIAGLEEVLQRVGQEIERTSIELKTSSRIKLLSSAETATPPDPKKRLLRAGALGLFGFLLAFAIALGWDMSRQRVDNPDALSGGLSLSCLGTVPLVASNPLHTATSKDRRAIGMDEAIRSITTLLTHRAQLEGHQVFLITSAAAGEGKSTLSCQIARSLAEYGKRVALVDFDLRSPKIFEYLQLANGPGVTEVLEGSVSLTAAMQQIPGSTLDVLTAGGCKVLLQRRVSSGSIDKLFAQLREHYDMVIVDSPPVLPVADSRILSKFVDRVILSLMRDVSRLPLVTEACAALRPFGTPIIGCITIGTARSSYKYGYGYGDGQNSESLLLAASPMTKAENN